MTCPAADISYQWPLLIAIGASIVLTIVGSILAGIGTGISAELRGRSASGEIAATTSGTSRSAAAAT